MPVLTYPDAKLINWDALVNDPGRVSKQVRLAKLSKYGHVIRGSLFFIAALDEMDTKAVKKFGIGVSVIQTAYNTGVAASAGTHDWDDCIDWEIPGVSVFDAQHFARFECGMADWGRTPAQGFPLHNHGFFLPPGGHVFPFKVGVFIDGGKSLGVSGYSSQIADYWAEAYGLKDMHYQSADPTPFPSDAAKLAGIFNLNNYIQKQREINMEYSDWSEASKREMAGDVADALAHRLLDVETVVWREDGQPDKNVPIRKSLQRDLNVNLGAKVPTDKP